MYQFGAEGNEEDVNGECELPRKRLKRIRKGSSDKLLVPKLNKVFINLSC